MPWDPRTRDEIRDTFLEDWAARAEDAGCPILITEGSYAWFVGSALALILESQEAQLHALAREILPDQSSTAFVDRHGGVEGLPREAAVAAVLAVTLAGTAFATVTFGSATLTAPDGTVYTPSELADGTGPSVTLDAGGAGTAYATARVAGTAGTQAAGTTLAWSSAPAGADPTVVVASTSTAGTAIESNGAYALRILARRQERPATANRADWVEWARAYDGVDDAVVYPLLHPTYGVNTLGAVTLVPIGPVQGDSPTNTRTDMASLVVGLGGTINVFAPATVPPGSFVIEQPGTVAQALELVAEFATAYAPPFAYSAGYLVVATSTATVVKVAGNLTTTFAAGRSILVNVGTVVYRGGFYKTAITSSSFDGTNTLIVVPTLPDVPTVGTIVHPAPANWSEIRTALFTLFDNLGPGDTSPACRWPGEETRLRSKLYRSAIVAALVAQYDATGALYRGVPGVLSVSVTTPGADVTPAAKSIVVLTTLSVHT
jgi:hypothetical protein